MGYIVGGFEALRNLDPHADIIKYLIAKETPRPQIIQCGTMFNSVEPDIEQPQASKDSKPAPARCPPPPSLPETLGTRMFPRQRSFQNMHGNPGPLPPRNASLNYVLVFPIINLITRLGHLTGHDRPWQAMAGHVRP